MTFTGKTENEIYEVVRSAKGELCGRFNAYQLQQPISKSEINTSLFNWRAIAASVFAFFAISKANAGNVPKVSTQIVANNGASKTDSIATIDDGNKRMITVTGIVVDSVTKEPILAAVVRIKGTKEGNVTAEDGSFKLSLDAAVNHTLEITFIGYEQKEISVNDLQKCNGVVKLAEAIKGGLDVIVVNSGSVYGKLKLKKHKHHTK